MVLEFGREDREFRRHKTFDGNRWNDLHYSRSFKEVARARSRNEYPDQSADTLWMPATVLCCTAPARGSRGTHRLAMDRHGRAVAASDPPLRTMYCRKSMTVTMTRRIMSVPPSGSNASWIGSLPELSPPAGTVPIICLPDYRQVLQKRATALYLYSSSNCNTAAPLGTSETAAIDGRGVPHIRGWPRSRHCSDNRTRESLMRALPVLATEPLAPLRGRRLDADDFDRLSVGDPVRDLWAGCPNPNRSRAL